MDDFQVGQKVLCVKTPEKHLGYGDEALPVAGNIYTIRSSFIFCDCVAYYLSEVVNLVRPYMPFGRESVQMEPGWPHRYFRPIRKTDISIFEKMLLTKPVNVMEGTAHDDRN